jgi:lipopolysaccharide biosynthesis regulator YciM
LIQEGKERQAAESWEKSYIKTGNPIFLQRLEDLFLQMGEPGEMIRIYQNALPRTGMEAALKLALGRLYYRLEMIDDAFELLSTLEGHSDPTGSIHKMMASLYIRRGNTEAALVEIQEDLSSSGPGCMAFQCTGCLYDTQEWSGRCPGCGRWNTIAISPAIGITHTPSERRQESDTLSLPTAGAPFEIV